MKKYWLLFVLVLFRKCIVLSALALVMLIIPASSQESIFSKIDTKDGLTSAFVYKVFEDKNGYLWFLTFKGISRYDGKNLTNFSQKDGFTGVGAYKVIEDRTGALWFVSTDFKLFRYDNNRFEEVLKNKLICWIDEDHMSNVLAITRFNKAGSTIYHINIKSLQPSLITRTLEQPYMILNYLPGEILVSSYGGVMRYRNGVLVDTIQCRKNHHSATIRLYKFGRDVYVTNELGIYKFDSNKGRLEWVYKMVDGEIHDMLFNSRDSTFLVATAFGLLKFKHHISINVKPEVYLNKKTILGVSLTKDGDIWVGTLDEGAIRSHTNSKHILTGEDKIVSVNKENGNIYFVSRFNTVYLFEDGKATPIKFNTSSKGFNTVVSRVLSLNDTLILINKRGSNSSFFIKNKQAYEDSSHFVLAEIYYYKSKGIVYYMGSEGVSYKIGNQEHSLMTKRDMSRMISFFKKRYVDIVLAGVLHLTNKSIYFKTNRGVLVANYAQPQKYYYINLECDVTGMTSQHGTLIIYSSNNGVYILNQAGIKNITTAEGLLSNYCSSASIRGNKLWICTNRGITIVDLLKQRVIKSYTANDYLIDEEVQNLLFDKGYVYAASSSGISVFKEDIITNFITPKVIIERVEVNNKKVDEINNVGFTYTQNNITISCNAPRYRSINNNTYQYIIKTNKRSDTILNTTGVLQLSSLSPGNYHISFHVRDIDGVWSKEEKVLSFHILPPFWESNLFFVVMGVFLILVTFIGLRLYAKYYRKQQAYRFSLAQSELKALRLYMNPHFIFNSLTSLQAFVLTGKMQEANSFISKFSKLIRSVMNYSLLGEITIQEEVALLTNYLNLEKLRFKKGLEFNIVVEKDIDTNYTKIPALIIQPIVENAVKHGLEENSEECGKVDVQFKKSGTFIVCTVTDNGKGVTDNKIGDGEHVSSGIKFAKERISLIPKVMLKEPINIVNMYRGGKVCGTKVEITIPILLNEYD